MRDALAKLNADMMKINPDYVVRITGGDDYGKAKLKYFISVSSPSAGECSVCACGAAVSCPLTAGQEAAIKGAVALNGGGVCLAAGGFAVGIFILMIGLSLAGVMISLGI